MYHPDERANNNNNKQKSRTHTPTHTKKHQLNVKPFFPDYFFYSGNSSNCTEECAAAVGLERDIVCICICWI